MDEAGDAACDDSGVRAGMIVAIAVVGCRSGAATPVSAGAGASAGAHASAGADASADAEPTVDVATDWCIEGMKGLDEDCCYVAPPGATRLLVYLHGIVPPVKDSVQKQTVERAVSNAAMRAGVAAIVPRGRRGIGPTGAHDWWAWPTSPDAHARMVKEIVARWAVLKKKLEDARGRAFEKTYLAGSSNGAYFLSAIALRGDADELGFPIDGYGAMSGGAPGGRGADALKGRAPRAIYVGYGAYDAETKPGALALGSVFERAHWPVRIAEHPLGHGANEVYLDEAFAFWVAH
jgi:predicted esterase